MGGKISRVLAAKLSLCCRVDALGDQVEPSLGKEFKEYVEKRLATLEETSMRSGTKGVSRPAQEKYEKTKDSKGEDAVEEAPAKKKKRAETEEAEEAPKKKKKKA